MRIIVYESSSRGGCYQYATMLVESYRRHQDVHSCEFILPLNSNYTDSQRILLPDFIIKFKWLSRFNFLLRSTLNPLILFTYLVFKKKRIVILNDFEQFTAPFWVPFFRLLKLKNVIITFLHDTDRDNFIGGKKYSSFCMKLIMGVTDVVLYHEELPQKDYYNNISNSLSVPHGLYKLKPNNTDYKKFDFINEQGYVFSILGNLREEKNYFLVLDAIKKIDGAQLIIAGSAANTSFDVKNLHHKIKSEHLENRVYLIDKFLDEQELGELIKVSNTILLYYKKGFNAQSGILNLVAPYRKSIIVSDLPNGLTSVVRRFDIGRITPADNLDALIHSMRLEMSEKSQVNWQKYLNFASWDNQVETVINHLNRIK